MVSAFFTEDSDKFEEYIELTKRGTSDKGKIAKHLQIIKDELAKVK